MSLKPVSGLSSRSLLRYYELLSCSSRKKIWNEFSHNEKPSLRHDLKPFAGEDMLTVLYVSESLESENHQTRFIKTVGRNR